MLELEEEEIGTLELSFFCTDNETFRNAGIRISNICGETQTKYKHIALFEMLNFGKYGIFFISF